MHILRSAREIAQMRKAGLLVWQAHQVSKSLVKPGVTINPADTSYGEQVLQPVLRRR